MPKAQLPSGLRLHYLQVGQGPDLVLIHGLTGNLAVWHLRIVPLLRDRFRVLTYDLRGHGYSDMPPTGYTVGDMATDLADLLAVLGVARPLLVGHSFGADIALNVALRWPERVERVVAIEPGLAALIHRRRREDWEGWAYWAQALERFGLVVPPERRTDVAYMLRLSLRVPKVYGPATGRPRKAEPLLRLIEQTTMVRDYEVVGDLTLENIPRITTPVLLIGGAGSAFLETYHYLRTHLPNGQAVLLPESAWGHFGPLEQPELVVAHLLRWLDPARSVEGSG
jgi:pimeloyl-ACP methyl ester carboxylesterase